MQVKLKVVQGKPLGKQFTLPVDRFVIGRADDCHLKPNSDLVDSHQCAIVHEGDQVRVEHLGSANGTHLNGVAVDGTVAVKTGDLLQVGPLVFAFNLVGSAAPAAPKSEKPVETSTSPDDSASVVPAVEAVAEQTEEADAEVAADLAVEPEAAAVQETNEPSPDSVEDLAESILSDLDTPSAPPEESATPEASTSPKVEEEDPVLDTAAEAPESSDPSESPSPIAESAEEPVMETPAKQTPPPKNEGLVSDANSEGGEDVMDWLMDGPEPVSTGSDPSAETPTADPAQHDANGQQAPSGQEAKQKSSTEKTSSVAADILRKWTQGGGQEDS